VLTPWSTNSVLTLRAQVRAGLIGVWCAGVGLSGMDLTGVSFTGGRSTWTAAGS